MLIASSRRWALVHELEEGEPKPSLAALLRRLSPADLAVVEGFKAFPHPKIEVHRAANGKPYLFREVANVRAIATDAPPPEAPLPVVPLDDVAAIADHALAAAAPLSAIIDALEGRPDRIRLRPDLPPTIGEP